MANTKISALTAATELAADDVLAGVDTSAVATKKVPMSLIIPSGGTDGQRLVKASSDYADLEWSDANQSNLAVYKQATAVTTAANVKKILPLTEVGNGISGMTVSSNIVTFPAGVYLVSCSVGGFYRCGSGAALMWDATADAMEVAGVAVYSNKNGTYAAPVSTFSHYLNLASANNYAFYMQTSTGITQWTSTTLTGVTPVYGTFSFLKIS